jgi:uncharacterized protein YndB with AHSA1/START domain
MTEHAAELTIRKTVTVEATQERAFAIFTEQIGAWWPLATKTIGSAAAQTAIIEPRAGGRWYERGVDGSECDWGRVVAYEPPRRLLLTWQISADWRHDPDVNTEVEVRFIAESASRTRVELEHRGLLEAYGDRAEELYAILDSPDGWTDILARFAETGGS